jgi:hypothetical protein
MKTNKNCGFVLLVYFLFFSPCGFAKEKPLLYLQIQESRARGIEETSLVFFRDRIELTTNTNRFIAEAVRQPLNNAYLGAFRSIDTKKWSTQLNELLVLNERNLRQEKIRNLPAFKKLAGSPHPHEVRISINGKKLNGGGIEFQEAWRILALISLETTWVNEDGIIVDFDANGKIRMELRKGKIGGGIATKDVEKCQNEILISNSICEITSLGFIYSSWLHRPKI